MSNNYTGRGYDGGLTIPAIEKYTGPPANTDPYWTKLIRKKIKDRIKRNKLERKTE